MTTGNKKDSNGGSKPSQEAAGSYDSKLVEMINTAIVDRSPAVKWDDVGEIMRSVSPFVCKVFLGFANCMSFFLQLVLTRQNKPF